MSKVSQTMEKDQYGNTAYRTLSPQEMKKANDFLSRLDRLLPAFESELKAEHDPTGLDFKYLLGEKLTNLLENEGFNPKERNYVFKEIKGLVATGLNEAIKDRNQKRTYYEYCYRLFNLGYEKAHAFNYHFWSDVFDRIALDEDPRIYDWFYQKKDNLPDKTYRFFAKTMTRYLKNIDTTVFDDKEFFDACDLCYEVALQYRSNLKKYFNGKEKNMSLARRTNLGKYKNKYVDLALQNLKFKSRNEWDSSCSSAFYTVFVDVDKTSSNLAAKEFKNF
jgi:hypothetical protein